MSDKHITLLPELVDYIIYVHTDALGLIMLSKTCKKYRSEYIAVIRRNGTLYIHHAIIPMYVYSITARTCQSLLKENTICTWREMDEDHNIVLPKIDHPFTAHMIRKILMCDWTTIHLSSFVRMSWALNR
jgi:hypothetical protein